MYKILPKGSELKSGYSASFRLKLFAFLCLAFFSKASTAQIRDSIIFKVDRAKLSKEEVKGVVKKKDAVLDTFKLTRADYSPKLKADVQKISALMIQYLDEKKNIRKDKSISSEVKTEKLSSLVQRTRNKLKDIVPQQTLDKMLPNQNL